MKNNSINILLGIIFILFGVIFVFAPESIFETIVMVAGIIIILFGVFRIISSSKTDDSLKSYMITTSVISIIFGIILIVYRGATIKLIASLIGIWFLISGISSLLLMLKSNIKDKRIAKPIIKSSIGLVSLLVPIIPIAAAGITIGIILIFAGVSILTKKKEDEVVYKVKVKK